MSQTNSSIMVGKNNPGNPGGPTGGLNNSSSTNSNNSSNLSMSDQNNRSSSSSNIANNSGNRIQRGGESSGGRARGRNFHNKYKGQAGESSRGNRGQVKYQKDDGGSIAIKHKQRKATDALLDESTIAGLDVDFAESILSSQLRNQRQSNNRSNSNQSTSHSSSSRKLNLSHLLNYKYDSSLLSQQYRNKHEKFSIGHAPTSRRSGNFFQGYNNYHNRFPAKEKPLKYNKQRFLQANCQFVVLMGPDYSIHSVDPDWPIDWDLVEEVRFLQCSSTETVCPICLSSPVAAKITRCGHIFCWPCMLHYLSLSDETWRQCPICFDTVYKNDLRSVVSYMYTSFRVGDEIKLRLMNRKKGCVQVEPYQRSPDPDAGSADQKTCESFKDESNNLTDTTPARHNLVIIDHDKLLENIIEREQKQLDEYFRDECDAPESIFIEQALKLLEDRRKRMIIKSYDQHKSLDSKLNELSLDTHSTLSTGCDNLTKPIRTSKNQSLHCHVSILQNHDQNQCLNQAHGQGYCDTKTKVRNYLFYQSIDGQHIYLNALNTKMLCQEYKSLELCPFILKAKILQMDCISMTDEWRRRYRYLEHLPLTCEFRLVELDLHSSGLISPLTFEMFESELKRRANERDKRRKEERKREKFIQVEQNRKIYGIQSAFNINLDNEEQFPSVMDERFSNFEQSKSSHRHFDNYEFPSSSSSSSAPSLSPCPSENESHDVIATDEKDCNLEIEKKEATDILQQDPPGPFSFRALQLQQEAEQKQLELAKRKSALKTQSFAELLTEGSILKKSQNLKSDQSPWVNRSSPKPTTHAQVILPSTSSSSATIQHTASAGPSNSKTVTNSWSSKFK